MAKIMIARVVLWMLDALLASPMAYFLARCSVARLAANDECARSAVVTTSSGSYVVASVLVFGAAGLLVGLAGYCFIGFWMRVKAWPGMLAFLALSFLGFQLSKSF